MVDLEFAGVWLHVVDGVSDVHSITNVIHGDVLIRSFDGSITDHRFESLSIHRRIIVQLRDLLFTEIAVVSFQCFEIRHHRVVEIRLVSADLKIAENCASKTSEQRRRRRSSAHALMLVVSAGTASTYSLEWWNSSEQCVVR